jgi:hypothetical protein
MSHFWQGEPVHSHPKLDLSTPKIASGGNAFGGVRDPCWAILDPYEISAGAYFPELLKAYCAATNAIVLSLGAAMRSARYFIEVGVPRALV